MKIDHKMPKTTKKPLVQIEPHMPNYICRPLQFKKKLYTTLKIGHVKCHKS